MKWIKPPFKKYLNKEQNKSILNAVKRDPYRIDGLEIKKFVQDIGLVGIAEIAAALGGIILIPLLTKTIGAYGYGLWQQVLVTVGILGPFTSLGLNNALVRFLPAKTKKQDKQNIFFSILIFKFITSCIPGILLIVFSEPMAKAFFGGATEIVALTGFIFVVDGANVVCQFYFRALRQIKIYSIIQVSTKYGMLALAFYMLVSGHGIFGVVFSCFVIETFFTLIYLFLILSSIGFSFPQFIGLKTWLRYGVPLIPTGLSLWIISFSDRYIIGYLLGITYVGIYSAPYTIGFSFYMIMEFINFVLVPTVSKLYDEGKIQDVKNYLWFVLKFYLMIAIPAVFGIFIISKQILTILTIPVIAEKAWMIMPIIAACTLFAGIREVFDKTLRLTKKTGRISLAVLVSAAVNLALNFLLIPPLGILGAAIATFIAYGLSAGLTISFSPREIKFKIKYRLIFKFVIASALMAGIGFIWHPITLISLILCVLVCIAVYFAILFLLGAIKREEIKILLDITHFNKH